MDSEGRLAPAEELAALRRAEQERALADGRLGAPPANGTPHVNGRAATAPRGRWAEFNRFMDRTASTLPPAEFRVWLVLFRHEHGGEVEASKGYISARTGLHPRNVTRALSALLSAGLLEIVHRGGLNAGPSRYRTHPERRKRP